MSNYFEKTETTTEYHVMSTDPNASGTVVGFGGETLTPVPFVSMSLEKYTVGDKTLGGLLNVSLNGVLYGENFSATGSELRTKILDLADKHSCVTGINIRCGDTEIIGSGIGYIKNYSFPEGPQKNWMNIIPYTIELAVTHDGVNPLVKADEFLQTKYDIDDTTAIRSIRESVSWSLDENTLQMFNPDPDDYATYSGLYTNEHITVNYSIDIQGFGICGTGCNGDMSVKNALDSAKHVADYRIHNLQNLNTDSFSCSASGLIPTNYDTTVRFDHTRDISVNELDGSLTVSGKYIIRPSGAVANRNTLITMESSADSSLDSGEKTITLTGSIRGLIQNEYTTDDNGSNYGHPDSETMMEKKEAGMEAAETALRQIVIEGSGIVKNLNKKHQLLQFTAGIGDIANTHDKKALANVDTSMGNTNTWQSGDPTDQEFRLLGKSFKRNYTNNSIDFTLTYSNKSRHKIPNALWAEISVDHEVPSRRLVEHIVPGRGYPLMQDILCDTQDVYTINVTAQFEPNKNIENIISAAREHILVLIYKTAVAMEIGGYIRTGDSENIANNGSYKRSIKLTGPSCQNYTATNNTASLDYLKAPGNIYTAAAGRADSEFTQDLLETPPTPDTIEPSLPEFDPERDKET